MKTLDDFAGVMTTGSGLKAAAPPRFEALSPAGRAWLRLDTAAGSALLRGEPGVKLDFDGGLMRLTARDGREFIASGVDEAAADAVVTAVRGAAAARCW